jgi:hypothetical protein
MWASSVTKHSARQPQSQTGKVTTRILHLHLAPSARRRSSGLRALLCFKSSNEFGDHLALFTSQRSKFQKAGCKTTVAAASSRQARCGATMPCKGLPLLLIHATTRSQRVDRKSDLPKLMPPRRAYSGTHGRSGWRLYTKHKERWLPYLLLLLVRRCISACVYGEAGTAPTCRA